MGNGFKSESKMFILAILTMFSLIMFYPKQAEASLASGLKDMIQQLLIIVDPVLPSWMQQNVRMGNLESDYTNLGLTETVELWEDGIRMDYTQEGFGFEWWYFDGTFDDGSSFVASFYPRMELDPTRPFVKLTVTTPEGEIFDRTMWGDHADSSYSTVQCDFNIGANNSVSSDNGTIYYIKSQVEDIGVDLVLERTVPPFRQDTGHIFIGNDEARYLAWFSMVPKGVLTGNITYNGETHTVSGIGYHDHNWGNVSTQEVTKGWWWMRGYVDDMAIIAYYFTFKNKYGATTIPIYGIMNSTDVLATYDSSRNTTFVGNDWGYPDVPNYSTCPLDRIPFGIDIQTGRWLDCFRDTNCLQIQFQSETLIESIDLLSMNVPPLTEEEMLLRQLLSYDPWYTRYTGSVNLEVQNFDGWSASGSGTAIIEYLDLE